MPDRRPGHTVDGAQIVLLLSRAVELERRAAHPDLLPDVRADLLAAARSYRTWAGQDDPTRTMQSNIARFRRRGDNFGGWTRPRQQDVMGEPRWAGRPTAERREDGRR